MLNLMFLFIRILKNASERNKLQVPEEVQLHFEVSENYIHVGERVQKYKLYLYFLTMKCTINLTSIMRKKKNRKVPERRDK